MKLDSKKTAVIFKAFCDENRIKILQLLQSGEKCACMLLEEMNITQPTLSHHMKILCDSGIVEGRKEGKWMHYSISSEGTAYARECFDALTTVNSSKENQSCCEK
ncbi:metalloregulator ArsR/SmtB family transcription factor [uncultured Ruminococcus sp.]|uniref:ArsR/SmtB family transcription factor n=1 Tax=uncultured Ruminococcus sp. TaxID=165186 RepID=UPI00262D906A|nr:metalloregulator ArsR/SmtB family transcription factor [uncultured Ruminococcus sp.]